MFSLQAYGKENSEKSRLVMSRVYFLISLIYHTYIGSSRLYLLIFGLQVYETENSKKSRPVMPCAYFLIYLTSRILQSSAVGETEEWSIISLPF